MLPHDLEKFNQAVELANSSQREKARRLLIELMRIYPEDANVLLWFAFTTPNRVQAQLALSKVRVIDPHNPSLVGAESWLATQLPTNDPGLALDSFLASKPTDTTKYKYQPSAADSGSPAAVSPPNWGRGLPIGKLVSAISGKLKRS
jgi:hypothetical protein